MLGLFRKLILVVVLCLLVLFAYQNAGPLSQTLQLRLHLYAWNGETPNIPMVFLLVVCFLLGVLAAGVHGVYERLGRRLDVRKRDKRIRALEKELAELRSEVERPRPPIGGEGGGAGAAGASSREIAGKNPRIEPPLNRTEKEPTL